MTSFSQDKKEVQELELKWLQAIEKRDTTVIKTILADDFVATYSDGSKETKQDMIARWKRKPVSDSFCINIYTFHSKANMSGKNVVLTGTVFTEEKVRGQIFKTEEKYEDIYQKANGEWKAIQSNTYKSN